MLPDDQAQTFKMVVPNVGSRIIGPGDLVGGLYRLKAKVGQGGMGCVFSAEHQVFKRDFAVKLIAPDQVNEETWRRFETEGRTIAKLEHPAIVKIYDMGVSDDTCPFYAMDLLEGISLDELCKPDAASTTEILEIFLTLAQAFAYAHGKGVIHRDIKPTNIILVKNAKGRLGPKILDFGIAKLTDKNSATSQSQTKTGEIIGSPLYMSPEQAQGTTCDERSDIYSLGCTLFEIFAGRPPFKGVSAMATILMHQNDPIPSVSEAAGRRKMPADVDNLLAKMLAKNKHQRYQSMAQVAHDLERLIDGRSVGSAAQATGAEPDDQSTDEKSGLPSALKSVAVSLIAVLFIGGLAWGGYHFWSIKNPPKIAHATTTAIEKPLPEFAPTLPDADDFDGGNGGGRMKSLKPYDPTDLAVLKAVRAIPTKRNTKTNPPTVTMQFPSVEMGRVSNQQMSYVACKTVTTPTDLPLIYSIYMPYHVVAIFYPQVFSYVPKDIFRGVDFTGMKQEMDLQTPLPEKDRDLMPQKVAEILQIATTWSKLDYVSISCTSLKNVDLAGILNPLEHLRVLHLRTIPDVDDEQLSKCQALKSVEDFTMSGATEATKTLLALCEYNRLKEVSMSGSKLTAPVAEGLSHCTSLTHLELKEGFENDMKVFEPLVKSKSINQVSFVDAPLKPETIEALLALRPSWKIQVMKDQCNEKSMAQLKAKGVTFFNPK